ncbi:MAG: hypothetical protein HY650_08405 [Acidobacteria bacterium]|nr:hypothetical protein [Acidobacteriota bacterium]
MWELKGRGFCTLCLFRVSSVQSIVPAVYDIKSVIPGYTLGGFYGTHYDSSPVGPYDELIVFPGFVGYGVRSGFHVSHVFVNNEKALHGGFNPLEAPRHLKRFGVEFRERKWSLTVYDAGEAAFISTGRCLTPGFPFSFSIPFLEEQGGDVRWYSALFDTKIQLAKARTRIGADASISSLGRARHLVSVYFQSLHVTLGLPMTVPERSRRPVPYPSPVAPAHLQPLRLLA